MPSANLDLVRSIYAEWERGDFRRAEWAHPEIEFVIADGLSPGSAVGVAEMRGRFNGWLSTWRDYRVEAKEYREIDDERVLVLFYFSGRGMTSGMDIGKMRATGAHVFHVRDGKVIRLVNYAVGDNALANLGLTPNTGT